MNIALITDDYIPHRGGVARSLINFHDGVEKLGEKIFVINNTLHDPKNLCFDIISSKKSLKSILSQKQNFFFFQFFLFYKIMLKFKFQGIGFNDRLKLSYYYCFYPKNLVNRVITIKNLFDFFNKHKIDIIFCGKSAHPLFYSYLISRLFKKPLITLAHGDDFITKYPFNLNNLLFKKLDRVIVTNEVMKKLFIKIHKVNPNKVSIVHLSVDTIANKVMETKSELRESFKVPKDLFVILTVSRFYPRKGFETVLKAIKLIIDENPNFLINYFVIGDGVERQKIERIIDELELRNNVRLLGSIDDALKNQYFKLADVFVLVPEVKKDSIEGFGIVYIEANFFKLPVIGSRSGGVIAAIEDGKSGFLIDSKDSIALKERIMDLYKSKGLREKMGEYGYQRVEKEYSMNAVSIDFQKILKETYYNYYKFSTGGNFQVKVKNPFKF